LAAHQSDRLSDRLLDQRLGREEIEIEILLDDPDTRARQGDGLGTDLSRDVRKFLP
jgi:hypothetical protein